jgi:RNA polymerase sigma factor (sigma-70 family)
VVITVKASSLKTRLGQEAWISTRWSLIQRLQQSGDDQSWQEFFDRYWRLIFNVALRSGLPHSEAQDVVQETIISLAKGIRKFTADPRAGSFKSWLLQLTRWRIVDVVRHRARELPLEAVRTNDSSGTAGVERVPDPARLELEAIWDEEWEQHRLQHALERLAQRVPANHYQMFYLYVVENKPADRVARLHGTSVDHVYQVKHRLMPIFEEELKTEESLTSGTAT